ncbi:MAG: anthrone oxygenase family protein [Mycobacterium sp.]|nr:anthrone oxygenase family protein [Mycobacterium sp.]
MSNPVLALTVVTAVGSVAVGGLFYAFSTFVMRGLNRTAPAEAAVAMRGINSEAQANAPFLVLFLGTGVLAVALGVTAIINQDGYLLAGTVLALLPTVVTIAFNVPLNNRLEAGLDWASYLGLWTAWNHVRTVTALLGGVLLVIAGTRR